MSVKKIAITILLVFSFASFQSVGACSLDNLKNCDRNGLISLIKELIKTKQALNKNALTKLQATEIVSNNLPGSIEFWTEAYCPNSGTKYDYQIPKEYNDYNILCSYGGIGSHRGCPTCIMSKIKFVKNEAGIQLKKDDNAETKPAINTIGLNDSIFYSDEKLVDYLIVKYLSDINTGLKDTLSLSQKIQRGKFDVLNDNDVAIVDISSGYVGSRVGAFFVIEKSKNYIIDYYETTDYRIGSIINTTPNYFVAKGKPFFEGYSGNSTSGGCVMGEYNTNVYKIYEGKIKNVFSYKTSFDGRTEEDVKIYNKNGFLTIIGQKNGYYDKNNCGDVCSPCEGDEFFKEDIFKIYKWSDSNQIFEIMDKDYINSEYSKILDFKYEADVKKYFNAESIEIDNLPASIVYISNNSCLESLIPQGYKRISCENGRVVLEQDKGS